MRRIALLFLALAVVLLTANLHAQAPQWKTRACSADQDNASNGWSWTHQEYVCEQRSTVLPLTGGQINVADKNGDIHVIGEDRNDVALTVRVTAYASSKDSAQQIERQVKITTDGTIHDDGPSDTGWFFRSGYTASYWLHVPRHLAAELHTVNGGIDIQDAEGTLHAETTNGGITLKNISGDVNARTVNGGIKANLTGDTLQGSGFSATTVNGGISLVVPNPYSAHLTAQTVNGGITVNFPITVQGSIGRNLDTNLGQGGPTVHLETVNGGVSISH